jgi:hypothetical protein
VVPMLLWRSQILRRLIGISNEVHVQVTPECDAFK